MTKNQFLGNLTYYGKKVKDFTIEEMELFQLDNIMTMLCHRKMLSEEKHDFMEFFTTSLELKLIETKRKNSVYGLLNITDEDKKEYSDMELHETIEKSVYSYSEFVRNHLNYQDDIKKFMKENDNSITNNICMN